MIKPFRISFFLLFLFICFIGCHKRSAEINLTDLSMRRGEEFFVNTDLSNVTAEFFIDVASIGGVCEDKTPCNRNSVEHPFCTVQRGLQCLNAYVLEESGGEKKPSLRTGVALQLRRGVYEEQCLEIPVSGADDTTRLIVRSYDREPAEFTPPGKMHCKAFGGTDDALHCTDRTVFFLHGADFITIENISFKDIEQHSVQIGTYKSEAVPTKGTRLVGNRFRRAKGECAHVEASGLRYADIQGNLFEGGNRGLHIVYGSESYGYRIKNNRFNNFEEKALFAGYTYQYRPGENETVRIEDNDFIDNYIAIDSLVAGAVITGNNFEGRREGLGIDGTGNHMRIENNRFSNMGIGIKLRQEDGYEQPMGRITEVISPSSFVFQTVPPPSVWPLMEGYGEARVLRDKSAHCLNTTFCNWAEKGEEDVKENMREIVSFSRLSTTEGVVAVETPISNLEVGDAIQLYPVYTDITIRRNFFSNMFFEAFETSKKTPDHLGYVASFRRIEFEGNQIHNTPLKEYEQSWSSPPAAIHIYQPGGSFVVKENNIQGGTANGIAVRQLDRWVHKVPAPFYRIAIENNCISQRREGMKGIYQKERIPEGGFASLSIRNNLFPSVEGTEGDIDRWNTLDPHSDCQNRMP